MRAVEREGVRVADLRAQRKGRGGEALRLLELPGADRQHDLDRLHDEEHAGAAQRVGAEAQVLERGGRARVTQQEQVHRLPAEPEQREQVVAGRDRRRDQVGRDGQAAPGVLRYEKRMVRERERLGQGLRVARAPGGLEPFQDGSDGGVEVALLGGQAHGQARAQHVLLRGRKRLHGAPLKREHALGVVGQPVLAQPDAAQSQRGTAPATPGRLRARTRAPPA